MCVGEGVGVNIGWGTLPWGDRSEHWVGTLPYPTAVFSLGIFLGDTCPPASVKWGTSDNFRGQNYSAAAKIAFDFKSCMKTPFFNAPSIQAFQELYFVCIRILMFS